jgi:glycosyltransferase involved in cell wall biosynthesis
MLFRDRPAVVIATGFSVGTLKVWIANFMLPMRYIIWSGAVANDYRRVSTPRHLLRRLVVTRAHGFIAYGSAARDYLVGLGAEKSRCHIAINTVDTAFFRDEAERWRGLQAAPGRHELLYVGNLAAGKRIDRLIRAVSELRRRRDDFVLRLVGDGPERARLAALAAELGVADAVVFEGFRQRDEIPRYLAAARCFVFPSEYDVWGLVLVEAMATAVPCISSIHAGATVDLIRDGETGFAIDFAQTEAVAERIEWMLENPAKAARIGHAGQDFIQRNAQIEHAAKGIVNALLYAVDGALKR